MMISKSLYSDSFSPNQLVLALEANGLTQREFAEKLGVSPSYLSQIISGAKNPETILEKASSILGVLRSFFYRTYSQPRVHVSHYRKRSSVLKRSLMRYEAEQVILDQSLNLLLRRIEIPQWEAISWTVSKDRTVKEAARFVRKKFGIDKGPVTSLVNKLENSGIVVFMIDSGDEKKDGVSFISSGGFPVIVLNSSAPFCRQRFTLAHELGHIVMHFHEQDMMTDRKYEQEANEFASEFLLPESEFSPKITNDIFEWGRYKLYWQVSIAALLYRAYGLGYMDKNKYLYLKRRLEGLSVHKREPVMFDVRPERPLLAREILKAYQSDLNYTMDDICSLLGIKSGLVRHLFNWPDRAENPFISISRFEN